MLSNLNPIQNKIVEELINTNKALSSKFLANSTGMSSKTIRTYMSIIGDELSNYGITLESKTGSGYWITVNDQEKYRELIRKFNCDESSLSIERDRAHFIIREIICNDDIVDIYCLEDYMHLSQTSLKQSISMAKSLISRFDINIINRKEGFTISGNEHDIRLAILFENTFYELCDIRCDIEESYEKYIFDKKILDNIQEIIIDEQEKFFNLNINDFTLEAIARLIMISSTRNDEGKYIDYSDNVVTRFTNRNCYYMAKIITDRCKDELGINLKLYDVVLLSIAFVGWRIILDEKQVTQQYLLKGKNVALEVMHYLQKTNNFCYITKDLDIINKLSLHLTSFFTRSEFNLKRSQFLIENMNEISIMSRKLAMQSLIFMHKKYNTVISAEEIIRLANLFHAYFGRYPHKIKKCNVVIVSDIGVDAGNVIKERIERNFGLFLNEVDVMNLYSLKRSKLDKYSFIITSHDIEKLSFVPSYIPIVNADVFFNEDIKINIHKIFMNINDNTDFIFRNIFKKDNFHFDIDVKTKDECIRYIGKQLMKDENDYINYIDDITLSEEFYGAEPKNNVVLITGLESYLERMSIHVFVLKKPISWGEGGKKSQIIVYWDQGKVADDAYYFESEYMPHLYDEIFTNQIVVDQILTNFDYENLMLYIKEFKVKVTMNGKSFR